MTYAPQALLDARAFLKPLTGLSDVELGIAPDAAHDGGYHCGWDQRRIVDGVLHDYAWQESTRDSSHKTNAARAFDVGMFPRLREMSLWIVQQCQAGAPDTLDIREVIYSPDGFTVKRWDRLGKRSSGDSSHLTHTHISYFADAEDRDKTALFRRFFEGASMTDTPGAITEQWRVLSYLTLDPAKAAYKDIPAGARLATVPVIDLLKRVDSGVAKLLETAPTGGVDIAALVEALKPALRDIVREELDKTKLSGA